MKFAGKILKSISKSWKIATVVAEITMFVSLAVDCVREVVRSAKGFKKGAV